MSDYTIPSRPVSEDGFQFDSVLERDWAGFVAHTGLRWRQEPFAIREGHGRTTPLNVVARPDFFLPDIAVIFECKPTRDHVLSGESRWRREAAITGLPVVVTEGRPIPALVGESCVRVVMPPGLWLFNERGPSLQTYFAQCPDCNCFGLLATSDSVTGWIEAVVRRNYMRAPSESLVDLWLSACRHQPRWSVDSLVRAISANWPNVGTLAA